MCQVNRTMRKKIFSELNFLYEDNVCFREFLNDRHISNWRSFVTEVNRNYYDFLECDCGMCKSVLIFENLNYVVKIPFDMSEKTFGEEKDVPDFDYCRLEWRNYLMAEREKVSHHFAFTDYIGKFHGCPIYIQEKVVCDESGITDDAYFISFNQFKSDFEGGDLTEDEIADKFADDYYSDGDEVFVIAAEKWDDYDKFCDFCGENYITDLHAGNAGYRNGELVVVDFSGYCIRSEMRTEEWYKICKEAA